MPLPDTFHPVVRSWFRDRYGEPTEIQRLTWPRIAAGEHVLAVAPTGTGKTLAAFLCALDALLTGRWEPGRVRVLYVSPLKALNNDIRRNLLGPLAELSHALRAAGVEPGPVRVVTRSGDTPSDERRQTMRHPPEILVTTPESLHILLTSAAGRELLGGVRVLLLDEVHAVADTKRGVQLAVSVERLAAVAGEFQRVALSATVRPPERVAAWVGGFAIERCGDAARRVPRPVGVVEWPSSKRYVVSVRMPAREPAAGAGASGDLGTALEREGFWAPVVREIKGALGAGGTGLVFANGRRLAEKLAWLVNEGEPEPLVFAHHGSLSREIRALVEERLKSGRVRAVVATSSLELGIDVGSLEQVLLVQAPPSIASAVQRVGRSGHSVGAASRGTLLALTERDLLDAAVVARAVVDGEIEPVRPVEGALDVLAQALVSMCATEPWSIERIFELVRSAHPYHRLERAQFDLVLEMLAGRYASSRVHELRPLVTVDRAAGTVRGRSGADRAVYLGGGTIPDRGYYQLRRSDTLALVGELDEEFVWERSIGDSFTLGVQTWRVEQIGQSDVRVSPARSAPSMTPFWRADARDRGFLLSEKVGELVERVEARLEDPRLRDELAREHFLGPEAAEAMCELLARQKQALGGMLPHRRRVVVEHVAAEAGEGRAGQTIVHALWGGRVNRPLAIALQGAWSDRFGTRLEVSHDDSCLLLAADHAVRASELFSLVTSGSVESHLRRRLEQTGFFGALFRQAAGRALLLPRRSFRHRTPLWLTRLRAKKLLEAVSRFDDFPIVLETWRECVQDQFELETLRRLLDEVRDGAIEVREAFTAAPSPFAANVTYRQTNALMYEDDTPEQAGPSRLRADLVRQVALSASLRPRLDPTLVEAFERKLQRLEPGWAPRDAGELVDWVVDRVLVPGEQWEALLEAMRRDLGADPRELAPEVGARLVAIAARQGKGPRIVCAADAAVRVMCGLGIEPRSVRLVRALDDSVPVAMPRAAARRTRGDEAPPDAAEVAADLLRFHGPVALDRLGALLGLEEPRLREALESLVETERCVLDELCAGATGAEVCDADNLERLLRLSRARARPSLEPIPAEHLALLLASHQGLGRRDGAAQDLRAAIEPLLGLPVPAELWETDVLPARLPAYQPAWLDALLAETELEWWGCGTRRVAFGLPGDRDLVAGPRGREDDALDEVFPHREGRFRFDQLAAQRGGGRVDLWAKLWAWAWRGLVSNDGFSAVRLGVDTRFRHVQAIRAEAEAGVRGRAVRGGSVRAERWRKPMALGGMWYRLAACALPEDALDEQERDRERVRLVADRWGVVFRELLEREAPELAWPRLFRALRLLELGGELVAGQFVAGVQGAQFASPRAVRALEQGLDETRVCWMNAADPASPCGLGLPGLEGLPRRLPVHHLVLHGSRLVVISERRGARLEVRAPPGDPRLPEYLGFLSSMLTRPVRPARSVRIETINGEPAAASAYRGVLGELFHTARDLSTLRLMRRYP